MMASEAAYYRLGLRWPGTALSQRNLLKAQVRAALVSL